MIVLLPEGRAVCNADSTKLVKVVPTEVQGKKSFIVLVKLDDDAELMIKTVESLDEALTVADDVTNRLNEEDGNEDEVSEEIEEDVSDVDEVDQDDEGKDDDDDWGDDDESSSW